MKLFVIIPNYSVNEEVIQLACNAIQSFKETAECTVVVSDDRSPLDTSRIEALADVFLKREENGGFAAACNTGFEYAMKNGADYIVCSNTDIEAPKGWVEEFMRCFDKGADMVGGLGHKEKGAVNDRKDHAYVSEGGRLDDWMFPGGFYMVKRNLLEDVGFYDPLYEHGGVEDIDLFYRAKLAGKRLIMTPRVWYWHQEGATRYSDEEKGKQSVAFQKNVEYFKKKWGFDGVKELNSRILEDKRIND